MRVVFVSVSVCVCVCSLVDLISFFLSLSGGAKSMYKAAAAAAVCKKSRYRQCENKTVNEMNDAQKKHYFHPIIIIHSFINTSIYRYNYF